MIVIIDKDCDKKDSDKKDCVIIEKACNNWKWLW